MEDEDSGDAEDQIEDEEEMEEKDHDEADKMILQDDDDESSSENQDDSEASSHMNENTRPKKKKKTYHSCVVLRDFKGDLEKAGSFGNISDMGVSLILLFAEKDTTFNLALTCKWIYSVYLELRSYSLDFIRLEYLNSRCTQYKYLSSLFKPLISPSMTYNELKKEIVGNGREIVKGMENVIAFEPVDIMRDDPSLILPNKFSQRRNVLINLFQDFSQEDIEEGTVIRKDSPFHKMNLLRWKNFGVKNMNEFKVKVEENCSDMIRILLDCLWRHNASNKVGSNSDTCNKHRLSIWA